jgi:hypothetical protein
MGMRFSSIAFVALVACGGPSAENKEVCQKAHDRYVQCVGETMGEDMKKMVASPEKDGRAACAKSQPTVDAYKNCLPKTSCDQFMSCVMDLAMQEPK